MMRTEIIKTELQSYGVQLLNSAVEGRLGGAGPAEGITFSLGKTVMNVPVRGKYAQNSPYRVYRKKSSDHLYRLGEYIDRVDLADHTAFYSRATADGLLYKKIALVHGKDCLASTVLQSCRYWGKPEGCSFCAIGMSLKAGSTIRVKKPSQLAEAALASRAIGVKHLLFTSGSTPRGEKEINHLAACVKAVKAATGMPVQIQCIPPADPGLLTLLKEAGADSIGLHIESLDDDVLNKVAPFKAVLGWPGYRKAWLRAVELFGRGQATSFIIMGLGERLPRTFKRLKEMVDWGVYPFIVPLRPIPGTALGETLPPPPDLMRRVYEQTALFLAEAGLSGGNIAAGCGRCRACSALPDFEESLIKRPAVTCSPTAGEKERDAAMAIRRQVFVEEQGLFQNTDADEYDREAVHLVARIGDEIVGTVRLYRREETTWVGGRLAISPPHRQNGIGPLLVETAVSEAVARGASVFIAWVQKQNEQFFLDLGWRAKGGRKTIAGREHVLMQCEM